MSAPDTDRRAWGWVAALRDGTTIPWTRWSAEAEPSAPWLPGAQQLELLRRLNDEAARRGARVRPELAERVLTATVTGRGRPDLPLVGARPEPRFGSRPVDPADLSATELIRVAAGLLAEDLAAVDAGPTAPGPAPRTGRRRPWAPSYQLVGDPWLTEAVLEDLVRRGRPPRPAPAEVYVVAGDLATLVAHAWTVRAFEEGGAGWTEWLEGFVRHDRLPRRADVLTPARTWAQRVGRKHVTVVLDHDRLPRLLRTRRLAAPPALGASAVDLIRRVGVTLGILVRPERRGVLLRRVLAPRLDGLGGPPPAVPAEHLSWVTEKARRVRAAVAAEGYPVLGDPERLLPGPQGRGAPAEDDVLALALGLLLDPLVVGTKEER